MLRTPDWNKQFIMQTDASGYALGVVIQQQHEDRLHPVVFHSQSLLPAERNYDVHDKELAGVIFGFKCAQPLFLGAKHRYRANRPQKSAIFPGTSENIRTTSTLAGIPIRL